MRDDKLDSVLLSERWKDKSGNAINKHFPHYSTDQIRKRRKQLGIILEQVEGKDGRVIRTKYIGGKNVKPQELSQTQQELIEKGWHIALRLARKNSNHILKEDDLLGICHLALTRSAQLFRPGAGRSWEYYVYRGLSKVISNAFRAERERLDRESCLLEPDKIDVAKLRDEDVIGEDYGRPTELMGRFEQLRGLQRVTVEWLAGLDGAPKRSVDDIATFWNVDEDTALEIVEESREALAY